MLRERPQFSNGGIESLGVGTEEVGQAYTCATVGVCGTHRGHPSVSDNGKTLSNFGLRQMQGTFFAGWFTQVLTSDVI